MKQPAQYYIGQVSHRRFGGISHVLRYRIAYLLLDLDRLDEAATAGAVLQYRKSAG
jgi:DUF1365 family protein